MSLRDIESVTEDEALLRFSAAGFLSEDAELSRVLKACGEKVRDGLPDEEETGIQVQK